MKFRRATATAVASKSNNGDTTTGTTALSKPAFKYHVPELSFEEIMIRTSDNTATHVDSENSSKKRKSDPQRLHPQRRAFTALSPNADVNRQQQQDHSGLRSGTPTIKTQQRRLSLDSRLTPLNIFSHTQNDEHQPEETKLESSRASSTSSTSSDMEVDRSNEQNQQQLEHQQLQQEGQDLKNAENEYATMTATANDKLGNEQSWEYPKTPIPSHEALRKIHNVAKDNLKSHQYQLSVVAQSGVLSLEDVIIPAICYQEECALKKCEKLVRRSCARAYDEASTPQKMMTRKEYTDQNSTVQTISECRALVKQCEKQTRQAVQESRMERESRITQLMLTAEQEHVLREYEELQQRCLQERFEKKEHRAQQVRIGKEKRRSERKKNYPKNKEMWREVALLMTALSRLEREEKEWFAVKKQLDEKDEELKIMVENPTLVRERTKSMNISGDNKGSTGTSTIREDNKDQVSPLPDVEETVKHAVEDITLSTGRINQTLHDVLHLVEETEAVRKELYRKYTNDHQFCGYKDVDNPKGLIRDFVNTGD